METGKRFRVKNMGYYEAHCSGCGEATTADLLAFDMGRLIIKAVHKAAEERAFGKDSTWEVLYRLDLSLYYTWRDLQQDYHLQSGAYSKFVFTVGDLKRHLERMSGITFDQLVDVKDVTQSLAYNKLVRAIKTPLQEGKKAQHVDIDLREHALNIQRVVMLCKSKEENAVIVEMDIQVVLEQDDKGLPFAKKLRIKYEDDKVETVINNVCPTCGKVFYSEVGKHEEIIIGMAGSARVGKTAYLAALVDCIQKKGGNYGIQVIPSNDPEWLFFRDRILYAYQQGGKIDKTAFEGDGETIPLFSLEIKIFDRSYIFTFIDMPGEAFDSEEADAGVNFIVNSRKIINYAKMIWFCVAPEQVDAQLAKLAGLTTAEQDKVNTNIEQVMANIGYTMDAVCLGEKKHAAILITKSDMIHRRDGEEALCRKDEDVFMNYFYDGSLDFYNTGIFMMLSREYLHRATVIETTVASMFDKVGTFAVAAYGQPIPDEDDPDMLLGNMFTANDPFSATPSMVELPFLWTLATLGVFQARRLDGYYEEVRGRWPWSPVQQVYKEQVVNVDPNRLFDSDLQALYMNQNQTM